MEWWGLRQPPSFVSQLLKTAASWLQHGQTPTKLSSSNATNIPDGSILSPYILVEMLVLIFVLLKSCISKIKLLVNSYSGNSRDWGDHGFNENKAWCTNNQNYFHKKTAQQRGNKVHVKTPIRKGQKKREVLLSRCTPNGGYWCSYNAATTNRVFSAPSSG